MTGNDDNLDSHPQTCVRINVSINPVGESRGDLAGLIGNMAFDLGPIVGLSRQTSSSVNVQLVEEITNVLEHRSSPLMDELTVALSIVNDEFVVDVRAPQDQRAEASTDAWFPPDEPTATAVNPAMKTMRRKRVELSQLAATVRERRIDHARGGLELSRLTAEFKAHLEAEDKKRGRGGSGEGEGGSSPASADAVPLPLPKKPE